MKKIKILLTFITLVMVTVLLAGCGKGPFKVTLPEQATLITQNVDLNKVSYGQEIKFKMTTTSEGSWEVVDQYGALIVPKEGVYKVVVKSNLQITASIVEEQNTFNGNGQEFVVYVDNLTVDPRNPKYTGVFKEEKIAKIERAEKRYNVKIVYKQYPGNASWGGARERFIKEQAESAMSAQIYQIVSTSLPTLIKANVILPLNSLIENFGRGINLWENKKELTTFGNQIYSFDDAYPLIEEGLFFNMDLLADKLGEDRKNEPMDLWRQGKWNWESFEKLVKELNQKLDESQGYYPLGGRTYNWAYQMLAANGTKIVSNDLKTHLTEEGAVETFDFLNKIYKETGMWRDESPLDNASEPEFKQGKIAFHNGQSYWAFTNGKWAGREFQLGYVPYPKGPRVLEDNSNYYVNSVYGTSTYVISSSYKKEKIDPGNWDTVFHEEVIFKIWRDIQHFPENDGNGYPKGDVYKEQYQTVRMLPHYSNSDEHIKWADRISADFFYTVPEALTQADVDKSYMIRIQSAIRLGDVRNILTQLEKELRVSIIDHYGLDPNFYD